VLTWRHLSQIQYFDDLRVKRRFKSIEYKVLVMWSQRHLYLFLTLAFGGCVASNDVPEAHNVSLCELARDMPNDPNALYNVSLYTDFYVGWDPACPEHLVALWPLSTTALEFVQSPEYKRLVSEITIDPFNSEGIVDPGEGETYYRLVARFNVTARFSTNGWGKDDLSSFVRPAPFGQLIPISPRDLCVIGSVPAPPFNVGLWIGENSFHEQSATVALMGGKSFGVSFCE
jgi:hypothetical protein